MSHDPAIVRKAALHAALAAIVFPQAAFAMPKALPEALERMKAEGTFDNFVQMSQEHAEKHEWAPSRLRRGGPGTKTVDSVYSLVFLVEFPDQEADQEIYPPAHFDELLFSEGVLVNGSARDYYNENSYNQFTFDGETTTLWYMAPHDMAGWYCNADRIPGTPDDYGNGGGPKSVAGLIADVVALYDGDIDFSIFDGDDDGIVDSFFLVHAGPGAEATGNPDHIWSHRSSVNITTNDGVRLVDYTTEPENGKVGVFAHEFGHVLGLPDLYDTDYTSSGVGNWSIMASGSWAGGGTRPVHFDAWCKVELGWIDPVVIDQNDVLRNPFDVPRVEDHPVVYKLPVYLAPNWEYFLIENRQKVMMDVELPGEGLLIWHIDDARNGNRNEGSNPMNLSPHYQVTLEEADCYFNPWVYWESDGVPGSFDMEQADGVGGERGDLFPGTHGIRNFHASTWPNSHAYNNNDGDSKCAVLEISDSADTMTAVFDVVRVLPVLEVMGTLTDDGAGGDGDGRGESGESAELVLDLASVWGDAPNVTAVLSTTDPLVTITDAAGGFGDLDGGTHGTNEGDPFGIAIATLNEPVQVEFHLEITSEPLGHPYVSTADFKLVLGWPEVLMVDDDGGDDREEPFMEALANAGVTLYDEWSVAAGSGTVNSPFTTGNLTILWITGEESTETLTPDDRAALTPVIGAGTNFVLSGENFDEELAGTNFFADVLHVAADNNNTMAPVINGVAGHPVFGVFAEKGMAVVQASPSSLTPLDEAESAIEYAPAGGTAAVSYDGAPGGNTHKVVTFGFDLGMSQNEGLLWQYLISALRYTPTGVGGEVPPALLPERVVLEPNAPNPFNPSTTIFFALPQAASAALRIYDLRGGLVRTLVDRELHAGRHSLHWDGTNDAGEGLASGVYLYRLETPIGTSTRRMLLLK